MAKECKFEAVDAMKNKSDYICDAFIAGLQNSEIRRKVLESSKTELSEIVSLSQVYEDAKKNAEHFQGPHPASLSCAVSDHQNEDSEPVQAAAATRYTNQNQRCSWCGKERHQKFRCPARSHSCKKCGLVGHYEKVCRSSKKGPSASVYPVLASVPKKEPKCLEPSTFNVGVNGSTVNALFDTGSADNYIHPDAVKSCRLKVIPEAGEVAMADTEQRTQTAGYVLATLTVNGKKYTNSKLTILNHACASIILGIDFLAKHNQVTINYGGEGPPLVAGTDGEASPFSASLGALKVEPPLLFHNLTADCHPIRTKSRRFSIQDRLFIKAEVKRLLSEGIIEKSNSPWRSQVHVTGGGHQKKRMVVDYSRTINRFTLLDAYPLPRIDEMVNTMAQYKIFSTIDMLSAYHQIVIADEDKQYTAFEADGGLYQFCRLPFGVTNGVSVFQREMDSFVEENGLLGTSPYLDYNYMWEGSGRP